MRVTNCCCCCDLRTGTLVLAILTLIGSCLSVMSGVQSVFALSETTDQDLKQYIQAILPDCDDNCIGYVRIYMEASTWNKIVTGAISLAISSLMVHGVRRSRPGLLLPYLVQAGIGMVLIGLAIVACVVLAILVAPALGVGLAVVVCLLMALQYYFFVVVNSYRLQLMEEQGKSPSVLVEVGVGLDQPPPYAY